MHDFTKFKDAVSKQFAAMRSTGGRLFCTDVSKDELWSSYLASFPQGTNPTYRVRAEHDCSCCKQFIRTIGNVVAINEDGTIATIWDCDTDDETYDTVAAFMGELVRGRKVRDAFLHYERHVGTDHNYEEGDLRTVRWDHFRVDLPKPNSGIDTFAAKKDIPTLLGELRSTHDVFLRALKEISMDSIDTVLELIGQGSLYRGNDYKANVDRFRKVKVEFDKLLDQEQDVFVWSSIDRTPAAVSKIRSSAMGTLLVALSDGDLLEKAVGAFEKMVAPENYKRPTALVTQRMIDNARAEVEALGLTTALERRHASLRDVKVTDVIWADRTARNVMRDSDAFSGLTTKPIDSNRDLSRLESISVEKFISEVVPRAESIDVLLENRHAGNMVSLVAPVHEDAKPLFKWDNGFSWSYAGDVTDSIKEKVKQAGGNVTGDLCCRLAWNNYDDLDLHMVETKTGKSYEIYFANRGRKSPSGGDLDVDMNAHHGQTREPVENIFYSSRAKMRDGEYHLIVHQFAKRETKDFGFEVEVDFMGDVTRFGYAKAMRQGESVVVAKMRLTSRTFEIFESLPASTASREVWGLKTQDYVRVTALMYSPNFWGGHGVGNRHYLFMLDGCKNTEPLGPRGFYNEFLHEDLDKHRKVMELVGGKMRVPPATEELSGLGFSDTRRAELVVRVRGSFNRMLKITF